MARKVFGLAVIVVLTLVTSGIITFLLTSMNGSDMSPLVHDMTPQSSPTYVVVELGVVTVTISGGTMVYIPETFTNPFSAASIILALGTVSTERRDDSRQRKLRDRILDEIALSPGIHLREIHRTLGCAMGALQYHINHLVRDGFIISILTGNTRHFFIPDFSNNDQVLKLTALMRNPTIRSILLESISNGRVTQAQLSRTLSLDKSLISYYTSSLVQSDILNIIKVFGRERPLVISEWAQEAITGLGLLI